VDSLTADSLERNSAGDRIYGQSVTNRGGSGPAAKLDPDPRTAHSPKQEIQGVC
jgi:hypothetical protein